MLGGERFPIKQSGRVFLMLIIMFRQLRTMLNIHVQQNDKMTFKETWTRDVCVLTNLPEQVFNKEEG